MDPQTHGRMDGQTDGWMNSLIEMRGHILKMKNKIKMNMKVMLVNHNELNTALPRAFLLKNRALSDEANSLQMSDGSLVLLNTNSTAKWMILVLAILGSIIGISTMSFLALFLMVSLGLKWQLYETLIIVKK